MPPPNGIGGLPPPVVPNPPVVDPVVPQMPVQDPQLQPPQPPPPEQVANPPGQQIVHDPMVQAVVVNGAGGPNFGPGAGQALHLAQAHDLGGRPRLGHHVGEGVRGARREGGEARAGDGVGLGRFPAVRNERGQSRGLVA